MDVEVIGVTVEIFDRVKRKGEGKVKKDGRC